MWGHLLQHLLERQDVELNVDAGAGGELVFDELLRDHRGRIRSETKRIFDAVCFLPTARSHFVISGEAPSPASAGVARPPARRWLLPSMAVAKLDRPTPAMASRRRNWRLPIRRSAKAWALVAT